MTASWTAAEINVLHMFNKIRNKILSSVSGPKHYVARYGVAWETNDTATLTVLTDELFSWSSLDPDICAHVDFAEVQKMVIEIFYIITRLGLRTNSHSTSLNPEFLYNRLEVLIYEMECKFLGVK